MTIREKKWTNNLYELSCETKKVDYKLFVYNYPNSIIKLIRYNKQKETSKILFDASLTKENYVKAIKIIKGLINEGDKYDKKESYYRHCRDYSKSSYDSQDYINY